ncbi:uncharacterized protein LOC127740543 [Arachis duranensis]|uniref:Uncharacterized protein LOC127740543 n=1 Tax=Arachis duranensis TaxID=130453 RepID=A0A9C6WJ36_ARADU|nr:uncharacterized protein LOC127740543 [Arachis duranensis]
METNIIAFGCGGEATSFKPYRNPSSGSDNSAFSGVREKEYKEPWDYYSNYPVTLPLRRPYSGNPELLDEEEFGEAAESRTLNENSTNPAKELGLLKENPETSVFLIQLPAALPAIKGSASFGSQDGSESSSKPQGSMKKVKPCKLNELPPGLMGKMPVYKSGAIKLKLGDTLYDVSPGSDCTFAQDVTVMNTGEKHCYFSFRMVIMLMSDKGKAIATTSKKRKHSKISTPSPYANYAKNPLNDTDKENQLLPSTDPEKFPNLYCELRLPKYQKKNLNIEKKLVLPNDVKRAINTRILELGLEFVDRDLGNINVSWVKEFYCNFFRPTLDSVQLWGREIMITETAIEEELQC